jgi:hypothetical protein
MGPAVAEAYLHQPTATVATFTGYRDAERALAHLSSRSFPVECVGLVAYELCVARRVLWRLRWWHLTLGGAAGGACASLGLTALVLARDAVVSPGLASGWGAVVGAALGTFWHATAGPEYVMLSRGRLEPVLVDIRTRPENVDQARRLMCVGEAEIEPTPPARRMALSWSSGQSPAPSPARRRYCKARNRRGAQKGSRRASPARGADRGPGTDHRR